MILSYIRFSLLLAVAAVLAGGLIGVAATGTALGGLSLAIVVAALTLLEVSLSFDNAIVNATVLRHMTPLWQDRFMTWGILIAVVGMRIVLPLALVAVMGNLNPLGVVRLAVEEPATYAKTLSAAHVPMCGFGGAFLALVGLSFFADRDKDVHWLALVERPLAALGRVPAFAMATVLLLTLLISQCLPAAEQLGFLRAGIAGLVTFAIVDGLATFLKVPSPTTGAARAGFGGFLYLEVLDASFSFDGVIGAFALSTNLAVVALGLGAGAVFVRSLTLLFVREGVLGRFRYLEHGAFYAILSLSAVMFVQAISHISELIAALVGAGILGLAVLGSMRHSRHTPLPPALTVTSDDARTTAEAAPPNTPPDN